MAQKQKDEGPKFHGGSPEKQAPKHGGGVPNQMFALQDAGFKAACEAAGVQPTRRQASKYRNQKGSAFKAKKG